MFTTMFTTMEVDKANRHPSAVPVGAAIFDEPVSYLDLKAWIAEQEALPQSEPLTDIQRRAILDLKRSIVKTKHNFGMDEADWVSLLMRYQQAHHPEGCEIEYNDNHQNQVGKVGFMCFVSLRVTKDWAPILFPSEANGLLQDETTKAGFVPQFTRKKDAKRYAAKSAVEWLMYQRYMPSDCQNVTFKTKSKLANPQNGQSKQTSIPATPSPPATTVKSEFNNGSNGAPLNQNAVSNTENSLAPYLAKPPPAAQPTRRRGTDDLLDIDVHDDSISVQQRVAEMCRRLGMHMPLIKVEPIPDTQNMFRGWANFPIEAGPVPEHVGRVESGVLKNPTKEMVAEQVLDFLFQLEQERIALYEAVIADD
ncbi:hypothetical protein N0V85_008322 [Neurospora sp. IMI 360204]|nr:hypothetical protein N0V85_008322 [Neurospora sp. IMI 360204]